jgi:hypothetical protein
MDVHYLRYQDDIIVLCKTKRQLNRCRQRMMEVLHERGLSLSRKKSRMGCISAGFHFLGIHYLPTQTEDNTNVIDRSHCSDSKAIPVHCLDEWVGVNRILNIKNVNLYAWFHIQERCAKLVNKLSLWLIVGFLPDASDAISFNGAVGGQKR